ncbi:MAG: transcriptional regulator, NifA subfamily, Fis Family [Acidobacteriales bacterium]|nr:transcriptional regulator, NifA subfamily, Fis Family [Terriglobales bacterium]
MSSQALASTRGRLVESRTTTSNPLLEIGRGPFSQQSQQPLANRHEVLMRVLLAVGEYHDLGELLSHLTTELGGFLRFDAIGLSQFDEIADRVDLHLAKVAFSAELGTDDAKRSTTSAWIHEHHECLDTRFPSEAYRTPSSSTQGSCASSAVMSGEGIKTYTALPLIRRNRVLGLMELGRRREEPFTPDEVTFLTQVANQVSIAVENALVCSQIARLKEILVQEELCVADELCSEYGFEEIVGRSEALRRVLRQIETVAPTDSTVLICGETGTGKGLIARAIHERSTRRTKAFVKLHCAAIPTGLLESELFGHEKGAFTGAIAQRLGRFEVANNGTAFLDEVSEIPLELQPKLLRVLQDREFERLGSSRTLRTNARLIAATNRDLESLVHEHQFRSDLFYRLNVFPVHVPPLRERPEDIPLLVRHFVQHLGRRMNKSIETIPSKTMEALCRYRWPGNVRELENVIERAVILSSGSELQVSLREFQNLSSRGPNGGKHKTLKEAERAHILATLKETKWVLGGPRGAAASLAMNRSTLQFRMKKLGIVRGVKAFEV